MMMGGGEFGGGGRFFKIRKSSAHAQKNKNHVIRQPTGQHNQSHAIHFTTILETRLVKVLVSGLIRRKAIKRNPILENALR